MRGANGGTRNLSRHPTETSRKRFDTIAGHYGPTTDKVYALRGTGLHKREIRLSPCNISPNILSRYFGDAFDIPEIGPRCLLYCGAQKSPAVQYPQTP